MKTVMIYTGNGFGPVSNWAIVAMCVSPAKAMEVQAEQVLKGYKTKTFNYDDFDQQLGMLG